MCGINKFFRGYRDVLIVLVLGVGKGEILDIGSFIVLRFFFKDFYVLLWGGYGIVGMEVFFFFDGIKFLGRELLVDLGMEFGDFIEVWGWYFIFCLMV